MTLCGFEIALGEKRQVKLPVPGGVPLEAWLFCGTHSGKTLVGCMAVSTSAFWLCKN